MIRFEGAKRCMENRKSGIDRQRKKYMHRRNLGVYDNANEVRHKC